MSMLDAALSWAARGFRVFPLAEGTKDQPLCSFTKEASTDEALIRAWWSDPMTGAVRSHNVGVLTTGMVVVDVDVRNAKPGLVNFLNLAGGFDTLTVRTPSGGYHCYYAGPDSAGRQGKHGLGDGLDIRSHGNYVVAPGSVTSEGVYSVDLDLPVSVVPPAVAVRLKPPLTRDNAASYALDETPGLVARATAFLTSDQAPPAIEGENGDDTTYRVACRLRDLGVSEQAAFALMLTHYNDRCDPPWEPDDLNAKVENAYNYATGAVGQMSPETHFADLQIPPVPPPEPISSGAFTFGNAIDPAAIPPRPWLMTRMLLRQHITVLAGPGSVGKSVLALTIAAHLAMGLPFLSYTPKYGAARSIVYDEEDDVAEMSRRLWAICHEYHFDFGFVRNEIALASRNELSFRLTTGDPPSINVPHVQALVDAAKDPRVGLVALGPFVSIHTTAEDDNVRMAFVMGVAREIAEATNVAILLGHHVSKPSGATSRAGDANSARGAGAIINSARFAFTMSTPTELDCDLYGVKKDERYDFVRLDDAKMNYARATAQANWLVKRSVKLANTDEVGVLMPHDMDHTALVTQTTWATTIAAGMKGAATGSCTLSDAANYLRAADPLAAKLPVATLRARVMTALGAAIETEHGKIRAIGEIKGGKMETVVVLE